MYKFDFFDKAKYYDYVEHVVGANHIFPCPRAYDDIELSINRVLPKGFSISHDDLEAMIKEYCNWLMYAYFSVDYSSEFKRFVKGAKEWLKFSSPRAKVIIGQEKWEYFTIYTFAYWFDYIKGNELYRANHLLYDKLLLGIIQLRMLINKPFFEDDATLIDEIITSKRELSDVEMVSYWQ